MKKETRKLQNVKQQKRKRRVSRKPSQNDFYDTEEKGSAQKSTDDNFKDSPFPGLESISFKGQLNLPGVSKENIFQFDFEPVELPSFEPVVLPSFEPFQFDCGDFHETEEFLKTMMEPDDVSQAFFESLKNAPFLLESLYPPDKLKSG